MPLLKKLLLCLPIRCHLKVNDRIHITWRRILKYKHEFTVVAASESQESLDYVNRILKEERDIEFAAKPLETSRFQLENIKFAYVFYEDGLMKRGLLLCFSKDVWFRMNYLR